MSAHKDVLLLVTKLLVVTTQHLVVQFQNIRTFQGYSTLKSFKSCQRAAEKDGLIKKWSVNHLLLLLLWPRRKGGGGGGGGSALDQNRSTDKSCTQVFLFANQTTKFLFFNCLVF